MIGQLLSWIGHRVIHWLGWRALLSLMLLSIALGSVAWALAKEIHGPDLELLLPVAIVALLLGWGLAAAKPLPGWLAGILTLILGVEAIVLRVGRLGGNVITVGRNLVDLARQTWRWPSEGIPPDGGMPLVLSLTGLWSDFSTLLTRLYVWSLALATGEPIFDPVAATLAWSLVLWGIAAWAGWVLRRREHPLLALAPAGGLLATILAYTLDNVDILLPVLGATLLLMSLTGYHTRQRHWQIHKIDFSPDIRIDLVMMVIPITLALTMIAWSIPSVSIQEIANFARQLFPEEPAIGSLGLRRKPDQQADLSEIRTPGLPRRHLLGSGPELSEQVALIINTGQLPIASSETEATPPIPRYYWRSLTYDNYNSRGWRTGKTKLIEYEAGQPTNPTVLPARRLLHQEVTVIDNHNHLLYAAGDLVTADYNYNIYWRDPNDPFAATIDAATYQVDSLIPTVSETELRSAGNDYPEWIRQRYFDLPDRLPARVSALARDLTATAPTAYDRARAIETYLRTFTYTLDLPEPPSDQDIVDYFLFDLQQGYCDYYATSMVVLARSSGLPARLAIGYAGGTYDATRAYYVVTEADAHSWPEIYFPGYGWIGFEPTAARQVIDRPAEISPPKIPELLPFPNAPAATLQGKLGQLLLFLPGGVILLVGGGMAWLAVERWRLRRLTPTATVATLYERLRQHGERLVGASQIGDTPYEFAASLTKQVNTLTREKRWQHMITPAGGEIRRLTGLYVQAAYSPHPPAPVDQTQAIRTWQQLRKRLWLVWVSAYWNRAEQAAQTTTNFE